MAAGLVLLAGVLALVLMAPRQAPGRRQPPSEESKKRTMEATTQPPRSWTIPFFAVWAGQACSLLGSNLVQFALIWWLTVRTGSATVLATASLVALLPQVLLGPFAGALVDRWSRKVVMIAADALIALATLGLAMLSAAGVLAPWHVYAAMLIRSLGSAFHWPAMQASTSLMVPDRHLARVAGLNQTLRGALNVIGPPLGALLIGLLPLHGVLAIDIGTAVLAILPLTWVAIPQPRRAADAGAGASVWKDMEAGLRYVCNWPGLRLICGMAALIDMVLIPASSLLPILVTRYFQGGAMQLGSLESAWGIGLGLGGLLLGVWGGFHRRIVTSLVGLVGTGLATLLIALAPAQAFPLAVAGMFLFGFMNPITNGPLFATVQAVVAPEMQGRVFTLMMSVCGAASPLTLAVAGPVADALGVQAWFGVGGVVCILMGVAAFSAPAIMHLESNRRGATQPAEQARVAAVQGAP